MNEVIPSAEVIQRIHDVMPLEKIEAHYSGETAERWRYTDGSGEIGVISSVTKAFCQDCTRARLSTEGKLFTCLFASNGHDLRSFLRNGSSDIEITTAIAHLWRARGDRYSQLRTANTAIPDQQVKRVEMSYIGG
jgi:cyclic pyranopterin phosphate synthase